jgi:2-(1,2-epoxy-1,2-dihydrophenyl)acetyl-CoA isomerase
MSYKNIKFEVDRKTHIATVTLNKPKKLNALNQDDAKDLLDLCAKVQADDDIWVVVWTGAGRGFCSGAEVSGPPQYPEPENLNEILDEESWISRQGKALYAIDKPMIAAINGVAAGAGMALALCCDLRVGWEKSRFVTVFQERSLPPEGGMSFLLSRIVGLSRAMDLNLLSRKVDGEEAYRMGLLDRLVEQEDVMPTAMALATRMCEIPPAAVRVSKRAIRAGLEASFAASSANETRYGGLARRAKEDAAESIASFTEKRAPVYKGR